MSPMIVSIELTMLPVVAGAVETILSPDVVVPVGVLAADVVVPVGATLVVLRNLVDSLGVSTAVELLEVSAGAVARSLTVWVVDVLAILSPV